MKSESEVAQSCPTLLDPMDCLEVFKDSVADLGVTGLGQTSLEMEKAMAPHSSTLAWKIPWVEEPGRLQSVGSLRFGHY